MREIGEAKIQRCLGNATDSSAFEGLPARSQPLLPNYGHRRFFVTGESPRDGANGNVVRLRQALNVQIWSPARSGWRRARPMRSISTHRISFRRLPVPMPFWRISPTPRETALPLQVATKLSKAPGWIPSSASFVTSTTWMWLASPSRRRC